MKGNSDHPATDAALNEVSRWRDFLRLSDEQIAAARAAAPILRSAVPELIEDFYRYLRSFPETAEHVKDPVVQARLRGTMRAYLESLLSDPVDDSYAKARAQIGQTHHTRRIDHRWYLGAYEMLLQGMLRRLAATRGPDAVLLADRFGSLLKLVIFDVGMVLDSYMRGREAEIEKSSRAFKTLYEIGVLHYQNPGASLQFAVERLVTLLGCRAGMVNLRDGDRIVFRAASGLPSALLSLGSIPLAGTLSEMVLRRGDIVSVSDLFASPDYGHVPRALGMDVRAYLGVPIRDAAGNTIGTVCLFSDAPREFSEREVELAAIFARHVGAEIEKEEQDDMLAAEREKLAMLVREMGAGLCVIDREYRVTWSNEYLRQWLAQGEAALESRRCFDLYGCATELGGDGLPPCDRCPAARCFESGRPARAEQVVHTRRGAAPRTFAVIATPIQDKKGYVREVLELAIDITDQKQLQEQFRQAEKLSSLGSLVSGTAHEINNPLTVILGNAQVLRSLHPTGEEGEMVEGIVGAAERCRQIVQDLLRFARKEPPKKTSLDVHALLDQGLNLRRREFEVHNMRIERDYAAELPLTAGDPQQILQVCLNLINNAFDAMWESGRGGSLTIRTRREENRIRIDFEDTGPGFKDLSKVFQPFYTTKPVGKGTGLGLSVCHGILQEHGGVVEIGHRPEGGARVTLWLPIETGAVEPVQRPDKRVEKPVRRARVLVVDDEPAILKLLVRILGAEHDVHTSADGEQAIALLKKKEFDIVVTDLVMPGGAGGAEVYAWIAAHRPDLKNRVVFSTGDTVRPESRDFLASLPNAVVPKPFSQEDLKAILGKVLEEPA